MPKKTIKKLEEETEEIEETEESSESPALLEARRMVEKFEETMKFLNDYQINRTSKLSLLLEEARKTVARLEKE